MELHTEKHIAPFAATQISVTLSQVLCDYGNIIGINVAKTVYH